ncbi:MAG TPA: hypothetical protein VMU93_07420 [Caulobacteraceae bacterium]|nr:hypothetical protein [Caulobacteraceae bacterium]
MRRIFLTPNFPPTGADIEAAAAAGAGEIVQGEGGYREIAEPGDAREHQALAALRRLAARRREQLERFRARVHGEDRAVPLTMERRCELAAAREALRGADASATADVEIADGLWLELRADELEALWTAAGAWTLACHRRARTLAATIAAAPAPLAVDIETGWPA